MGSGGAPADGGPMLARWPRHRRRATFHEELSTRVDARLFGMREPLKLVLIGILTGSHVLIDDVPGVGKTTLVRMLAGMLDLSFQRVQFTPDLMPTDITGTSVLNLRTNDFEFRPGPLFAQVLLADEINRATPKTQAALLEAMQEGQVTVDGTTYPLPGPSSCWRPRTRSSSRARSRCRRPSSTGSCCGFAWAIPSRPTRSGSSTGRAAGRSTPRRSPTHRRWPRSAIRSPPCAWSLRCAGTWWRSRTPPGSIPNWPSASVLARWNRWATPPGPTPCWTAAPTCCPTT